MKEFLHIFCLAFLLLLSGCKNEDPGFPTTPGTDDEVGYIVTSGLSVTVADNEIISTTTGESSPTKSESSGSEATNLTRSNNTQSAVDSTTTKTDPPTAEASDDYKVTILNTKTSETMNYTYADLKKEENQKIPVAPGTYKISAESPDYASYMAGDYYANWDMPVYAGSVTKNVIKATETTVNDLVCSLANIRTSVSLTPDLQSLFLPDDQATEQLPALTVTLSVGENSLVYDRAAADGEKYGYFKAVEATNTITVELKGAYNKASGDVEPEYVPVKWTREITGCKAGQWRKISIHVTNASQGNIQFQMTVENWVYDQKIDVDVTNLYAFGEEVIPDEDLSDANSPVVTLEGHDIAQGYTINQSMYNEDLGKWNENLQAIITPQSDVALRSVKLLFSSDNTTLLNDLSAAGYTDYTIPIWPQNDALNSYLLIQQGSTGLVKATLKDAGMTKLFNYKGVHTVKFIAVDSKGRTSYTNLKITVSEGGDIETKGPEIIWTNKDGSKTYDFNTRWKITKLSDTTADPEVKITVTSQTGITGFTVDINSTTLTAEELASLGLSTHMDLVNPGDFAGPLGNLGFPTGSDVEGKKELTFDISSFMPMLTVLGAGNSDFTLTVEDAGGQNSKTIQLYVP